MPSEKTVLILVHGWGADKMSWNPLRSFLDSRFETAAYDVRGSGENEGTLPEAEGWTLDGTVDQLVAEIENHPGRPVVAIGFSMGGAIVLSLAHRGHPRLIGVVAIGSSPRGMRSQDWNFGLDRDASAAMFERLRRDWIKSNEELAPLFFTDDDPAAARSAQVLLEASRRVRNPEIPIRILEKCLHEIDDRSEMPRVGVPALLIHGERDVVAPPGVGEWMVSEIPVTRLAIIPGAGHLPHLTASRAVAVRRDGHAVLAGEGERRDERARF
jgi:pimeloyl-ACP methyl ester carboxylesterase